MVENVDEIKKLASVNLTGASVNLVGTGVNVSKRVSVYNYPLFYSQIRKIFFCIDVAAMEQRRCDFGVQLIKTSSSSGC